VVPTRDLSEILSTWTGLRLPIQKGDTTYEWNMGDGTVAVGPAPVHIYRRAGDYSVDLLVTDGLPVTRRSTTAHIVEALAARADATGGNGRFTSTRESPRFA